MKVKGGRLILKGGRFLFIGGKDLKNEPVWLVRARILAKNEMSCMNDFLKEWRKRGGDLEDFINTRWTELKKQNMSNEKTNP